jgi:hypothetical protein
MSETRDATLEEMLDNPESVTSDAGSISNRNIKDAIALDKYLTAKEAVTAAPAYMGLRLGRFTAPEHY